MRGDGRILKRGRLWHFAYCVNGKEYRESSDSEDLEVAKKKLTKALARIECDQFVPPSQSRLRFEDIAADLTNYYVINRKASLESLPYYLKHLRLAFGMDRARNITDARIRKYIAERLRDGAKAASVNKELGALRRMFKLAVDGKRLSATSMPVIKLLTENNARAGFVEPADFMRLRDALPDYLQDPVSFLYASAWRVGEMRTLEWRDVDKNLGAIRLRPEKSKNRRGRTLVLEGELLEIMQRASDTRRLDSPFVFHYDGEPIGDFRKAWASACKVAGLAGITVHDLRRSGIRNAVRAGVREGVVMAMSGHRTRSVFDRYNISSDTDLAAAARKITEYVQSNQQQAKVSPIVKAS